MNEIKNNETKRDKFIRLAEARTTKIINMIELLGNCSNKGNYEYSQEDVDKIFDTIESVLDNTRSQFNQVKKEKIEFKL